MLPFQVLFCAFWSTANITLFTVLYKYVLELKNSLSLFYTIVHGNYLQINGLLMELVMEILLSVSAEFIERGLLAFGFISNVDTCSIDIACVDFVDCRCGFLLNASEFRSSACEVFKLLAARY